MLWITKKVGYILKSDQILVLNPAANGEQWHLYQILRHEQRASPRGERRRTPPGHGRKVVHENGPSCFSSYSTRVIALRCDAEDAMVVTLVVARLYVSAESPLPLKHDEKPIQSS